MRKFLRSFVMMALLAVPFVTQAQVTCDNGTLATVANAETGTLTSSYIPGYSYYNYSYSEVIIPASEIELLDFEVKALQFKPTSTNGGSYFNNCDIYLCNTTKADLSSGFAHATELSNFVLVYSGSLNYTTTDWQTVNFTTNFTWDGSSNILVAVHRKHGSYQNGSQFQAYTAPTQLARYQYNDNNSYAQISAFTAGSATTTVSLYHLIGCGTLPTCSRVTDLTASSITSNSAVLTWTDANNTGATYTVYNGSTVLASGLTSTTYNLTGLDANTQYTISVRANCSATDESTVANVIFRTDCGIISSLPYVDGLEAFPSGSYQMPFCWTKNNGGVGNYPYSYSSNAHSGSRSLYFYAGTAASAANNMYAIMPQLDVTTYPMNSVMLEFYARTSNANPLTVEVGSMSDPTDATTFVADSVFTMSGTTYNRYVVRMGVNSPATNSYIAVHVIKPTSYNSLYVDDFTIYEQPSCWPVTNLATSNPTETSTVLSWTDYENTATYSLYIDGELVSDNVTSPYTITGLELDNDYEISVVANCGAGDLSTAEVLEYHHGYCLPNPTSRDGQGISNVTFGNFMTVNNSAQHPTSAPYYGNYASMVGAAIIEDGSFDVNVTMATGYTYGNIIWIDWNKDFTFSDDEIVYTGTSESTNPTTYTAHIAIPATAAEGYYRMRIAGADSYFDSYVGGTATGAHDPCFESSWAVAEDYTVFVAHTPTCFPLVSLAVENITSNSVTLSWVDTNAAATYTIMNGETQVATGVTDTFYTVAGLEADTDYTFSVIANCSATDESWPLSVTAHTYCTMTLPFAEDFEDIEYNGAWPECWIRINNYNTDPSANYEDNHTDGGENSMYMQAYNTYNMFSTAAVPVAGNNIYVSFWAKMSTSASAWLKAGVMTNPLDTATFIPMVEIAGGSANSSWKQYEFVTTGLDANATYYVAWQGYGVSSYSALAFVDDIDIDTVPVYNVTINTLVLEDGVAMGTAEATPAAPFWGDSVTVVSTPATNMRTAFWYAGTDTTGATPLAIDTNTFKFGPVISDTTITVVYGYGQFEIVAVPNQDRMGEVLAINNRYGNNMYDYATVDTFIAVPQYGFQFVEWIDNEDHSILGTDDTLVLEALRTYDITARFLIDNYSINIVTEHGTVTGADQEYMFGEVATITAVPDEHYEFYYWADTVDGVSIAADATLSFRMLGDTTFYPVFGPLQYTVTIDGDPTRATYVIKHGDDENTTGTGDYTYGDTLTVIARDINSNYDWMGWKVGDETVTTDTAYTFVLEDNITFFANIPGGMYTMTFDVNDMDMGSVAIDSVRLEDGTVVDYTDSTTLTVTLNYGSIIYATATPVMQYAQFNGWSHGTNDLMATSAAFNVVSDTTVTANFGFQVYNVTLNINPELTGTAVADPAAPEYGQAVTFTATAEPHWVFANWTDTLGTVVSTDAEYTINFLFEDIILTANFVRDSHDIYAVVVDETHGTTTVTNADGEETFRFLHEDMATVEFTAGYGYTFAGWSNGTEIVSNDNPFTFEVTEDTTLTATVNPIIYNVTLRLSDEDEARGAGSVSPLTQEIAYLSTATLNAEANHGYVFDYWANEDGDVLDTDAPVIESDTTFVAYFKFDQFTLTGDHTNDCRMMGNVAGSGTYDYTTEVNLIANANYGYEFVKWVDAEGNEIVVDNVNVIEIDRDTLTVRVLDDTAFYAEFTYLPMDVVVTANDDNFGTVTGAGTYAFSQTVTIKATAEEHYHFVAWNDDNTDNPRTFILTQDTAFEAIFAIDTHQVTLNYAEANVEMLTIQPTDATAESFEGNRYIYGTELVATLVPAYGFTFNGWSFDGQTIVETANTITFTLTQDTTLTPMFTAEQYTITAQVAAGDEAKGTVNGTNTVDYLQYVILQAHTNYGYDFVNWTNQDGTVASTDSIFTVQALKDSVLTAHFTEHKFTLTIASDDEVMGTVAFNDGPVMGNETVAEGDASTYMAYVPIYGSWMDSPNGTQSVYPASMLANIPVGSKITSLHYYVRGTNNGSSWGDTKPMLVKLMEVEESNLSGGFIDVTNAATVLNGTLVGSQVTPANGFDVTFDQPFTYNGGNLLIAFQVNPEGLSGYKSVYFRNVSATGGSRYAYNNAGYNFTATGTIANYLPMVTFTYEEPSVSVVEYDHTNGTATAPYMTAVAVNATANYGYHFTGWDNGEATESTSVVLESDTAITANFAKNNYTINVATQFNHGATGSVAITGTTENFITVEYLDDVTITATVTDPYRLLKWVDQNGENLGTANPLTINVTRDSTITAVLDYEKYLLTIASEDNNMGTVEFPDANTIPVLTQDAADGTANSSVVPFDGYNADASQHNQMIYPASALSSMVSGNISKMVFYIDQSASNGSNTAADRLGTWTVSLGETSATTLTGLDNTTTLTQVYNGNFDCSTGLLTLEFATPYTYNGGNLLVDLNHAAASWNRWYFLGVEATGASYTYGSQRNFLPKVTFTYTGEGPVSYDGNEATADYNSAVAIAAIPADHYHFVAWKGTDTVATLTNATETITVLGDSTLTALFDGDQMPMTYQTNYALRGSVEGPATWEYNTEVTFEAVAAHGYVFSKWEDGDLNNPRTVTVAGTDAENTYKAIFEYQEYEVRAVVENGSLANEPQNPYFYGTQITLTAVADEHYSNWKGWLDAEGNVVSTANPYTFFVLEDIDLTGKFDIDTFNVTLTVNDPAMGSITGVDELTFEAIYGTEFTVNAVEAGDDYHFVNWSDDVEDAERTITVEDDVTLTANFALNQYNIATVATNGTAVWAGYDYAYPTVNVTINAEDSYGDGWNGNTLNIVKDGSVIDSYTMAGQGVYNTTIYDSYSNSYVADSPITIEWISGGTYSYPDEVSFTINVDGTDVYTISDCSGFTDGQLVYTIAAGTPAMTEVVAEGTTPVDPHTNLTFTATPDAGYSFVNWTDPEGNIVSSANPVIIEIVSDTTLTANFSTEVYTAYAVSTDLVKGTVSPDSANLTVESGALFTASPKYGYVFNNWTDKNGVELSTEAAFTLTDVTVDTIYANFNYDYFDVTVQANDATFGTVALNSDATVLTGNFPYGDTVNLSATAAEGYYFVNWTDNNGSVVSDQNSARFIVEADVTYTANFADGSEYTITAVADTSVHGQVTGAGTYMAGTTVVLTAVEFPNYFFTAWNDGNTDNPRTINVTANADYIAYYDTVAYTVTVNGVDSLVKYGRSFTANADVDACRTFNGWSNGTDVVASGNQYTFVVTGDIALTGSYSDSITFTAEETVAYCGAYNWNGEDRTATGDYTYATTTANGCDSIVTLHLTVSEVMTGTDVQTSCGSFTWIDGNTYTESNNTATYTTTASNGCDSVVTLNLTINNPVGTSTTVAQCGAYTWNGTEYATSGTYNYSYTDNNGCTVVDTLVLTVNLPTTETVNASACGSYSWNGETYTASGIYSDTLTNAAGCDSIVTLALTINQPVYTTVNQTACDSYVWTSGNGQTYTESGSYTINGVAANGCDSIVTLNLTINQSVSDTIFDTVCGSYTWNGTDYTTSGTYTLNATAVNGCDSIVTLNLTVNEAYAVNDTIVTDLQNVVWNGMTLTESGVYTYTATAANGCDSVATLYLTINAAQTNYYTVTVVYDDANMSGMGSFTGAGTYEATTPVTLEATANDGFTFVGWKSAGEIVCTTALYTFTPVSDTTISAVFEAVPVMYTLTGVANDSTMGSVIGSGTYVAGTSHTLTANANEGYHFVRWSNGETTPAITITLTGDLTLTAYFEADPSVGIDESDMENVTIYSAESRIIVRGAEGKDVSVYDINGRTISRQANASETVEFRMAATGVYLVKVGNAPAKRVLVVR